MNFLFSLSAIVSSKRNINSKTTDCRHNRIDDDDQCEFLTSVSMCNTVLLNINV